MLGYQVILKLLFYAIHTSHIPCILYDLLYSIHYLWGNNGGCIMYKIWICMKKIFPGLPGSVLKQCVLFFFMRFKVIFESGSSRVSLNLNPNCMHLDQTLNTFVKSTFFCTSIFGRLLLKQGKTVHMLQLFGIYIPLARLYIYVYIFKYIYTQIQIYIHIYFHVLLLNFM